MIISIEYLDYTNVFLKKIATKLIKHFNINKYITNLKLSKQVLYKLIYSLRLIKLKTPKFYIKIKLANDFIYLSNFLAQILILLVQKSNSSFALYINYGYFNNLTVKSFYLFSLMRKLLNSLHYAK